MLKQVELTVRGPNIMRDLSAKYACKLNMVDCKSFDDHTMSLLTEIEGEQAKQLIQDLRQAPGIKRVFSARGESHKTLAMVILEASPYCISARNAGAFCITCPFKPADGREMTRDGDVNGGGRSHHHYADEGSWKLLVNDAAGLKTVADSLAKRGIGMTVRDVSNAFHDELLTDRQRVIMSTAYTLGYFEFPRKNDLTEIAKDLSIRPSTLSEILRRAEAKIVKHYMETIKSS